MIVVIQSDDYEGGGGGQGLVVVDPAQLQQLQNGVPGSLQITQDGQIIQVQPLAQFYSLCFFVKKIISICP